LLKLSKAAPAKVTGDKFVDRANTAVYALTTLTRPALTFLFVLIYAGIKYAQYLMLMHSGACSMEAVTGIWAEGDNELIAAIVSFWFGSRTISRTFK
jgi:hypothetical protein